MPSILFVCFANRFRSPLAAAFFSHCLEQVSDPGSWLVSSAGTWTKTGLPADIRAIQDASNWGLDINSHRSCQVDVSILSERDLVLVMEAGQKEALQIEFPKELEKIHLLSEVVDGTNYDIPDPFNQASIPHEEIAKELFDMINRGFKNIYDLALESQNTDPDNTTTRYPS
jgi:protein-tyrosine phosphatase